MTNFPSTLTCSTLTKYLASLYEQTENSGTYNARIYVSVIKSLGELGGNEAFDTILYVMSYKDFPSEIIETSNEALKKLKW